MQLKSVYSDLMHCHDDTNVLPNFFFIPLTSWGNCVSLKNEKYVEG